MSSICVWNCPSISHIDIHIHRHTPARPHTTYSRTHAQTHALTQVLRNLKELDLSMNLYTQMPDQLLWKDRYFVEV